MIRFRIKLTTTLALVALSCSGLANAKSFVAKCEKNNKLSVRFSGSNCDLDWNKGGESNRCRIKNSIMKFSTYDSGGQAKLDLTSGELRHGAKIYKCILSKLTFSAFSAGRYLKDFFHISNKHTVE